MSELVSRSICLKIERAQEQTCRVHRSLIVSKVWKDVFDFGSARHYLLGQQVELVEKQNGGDVLEPSVVPQVLEQVEGLFETVLGGVFAQCQVVAAHRCHKYDGSDVVEALDPFATLVTLTTDVKHTKRVG